MNDEILEGIVAAAEEKSALVLVTLLRTEPPVEGLPGRKLLVRRDGETSGSLGAPDLDEQARALALDALRAGEPRRTRLESPALARSAGMFPLIVDLFVDPLIPAPSLVIVGAGHIALPLSRMGKLLGFQVVIVDDRESFANRDRFPEADELVVDDIVAAVGRLHITPSTCIVLVTRGHRHDEAALRAVVNAEVAYLGMIGSRRRVLTVLGHLEAEGIPAEPLRRVRAPIGLDLGGHTPQEIALSILSEIVMVQRGGTGVPLSSRRGGRAALP